MNCKKSSKYIEGNAWSSERSRKMRSNWSFKTSNSPSTNEASKRAYMCKCPFSAMQRVSLIIKVLWIQIWLQMWIQIWQPCRRRRWPSIWRIMFNLELPSILHPRLYVVVSIWISKWLWHATACKSSCRKEQTNAVKPRSKQRLLLNKPKKLMPVDVKIRKLLPNCKRSWTLSHQVRRQIELNIRPKTSW